MELFNVYICKVSNFKAVQKVGDSLGELAASVKGQEAMDGLNTLKYFPVVTSVGCARDLELSEDI